MLSLYAQHWIPVLPLDDGNNTGILPHGGSLSMMRPMW